MPKPNREPITDADLTYSDDFRLTDEGKIRAFVKTRDGADVLLDVPLRAGEDFMDLYAEYDPKSGRVEAYYTILNAYGDRSAPEYVEDLTDDERRVLLESMRESGADEMRALTEKAYAGRFNPRLCNEIEPYLPGDGAALRYSRYQFFRNGECVGFGSRDQHIGREDVANVARDDFVRYRALEDVKIEVRNFVYGKGDFERDVSDAEGILAAQGAIEKGEVEASTQTFHYRREDFDLPPMSPLTERGMSKFFTAAAEAAAQMGFTAGEITEHGELQILRHGAKMIKLYEDVCGSYARHDSPAFEEKIQRFFAKAQALRAEIPEILHPHDYGLAPKLAGAPSESAKLRDFLGNEKLSGAHLVHKTADVGFISADNLAMLTEDGLETYAALLDANVTEIRDGAYGVEFVLDGVDPQILSDFDQAAADRIRAEHTMGDMSL
jgi:hypothetical protein